MYDYCLNVNPNNKAMQPFLDLKRNYFNLLISKWVQEMNKRFHYVNSFHTFYAKNNDFELIETDFFLILECCIQWDLKGFLPYKSNLTWYEISLELMNKKNKIIKNFTKKKYSELLIWYKNRFMVFNKSGNLKPKQLNIIEVINYFEKVLLC